MTDVIPALRRLTLDRDPVESSAPVERCDMCATPLPAEHRHVAELEQRRILCACRPCALLFDPRGAGRGHFRLVPERVLHDPDERIAADVWERLELPVGVVFVFHQSSLGRPVACYPGPAGATESTLSLAAWSDVCAAVSSARLLEPDVEALLMRKQRHTGTAECFVVPIDVCYELVGRIRTLWRGFDGGAEVEDAVNAFFAALTARARRPEVAR